MLTAVIELTEKCNLGCTFCLRPSFNNSVMSLDILEKVVKSLFDYEKERIDFIWHGGEPLILGLAFFEKMIKFQNKYNKNKIKIFNDVQTNATLLSKDFIKFFEKNKFSIGTSIQGPKAVHDKTRINLSGAGTFDLVNSRIKNLQKKPSAITVLTKDIINREKETYKTLKKSIRGARISEYFPGGIIPNSKSGCKDPSMLSSKEYGESMLRFYKIWKKDKQPLELRPITEIIRSFIQGKSNGCIYSQESCNFVVIGIKWNGDFYTCLRAVGNKTFLLGNIKRENPMKKFSSFGKRDYKARIKALKKEGCLGCEFFNQCGGGCPQESFILYKDFKHKPYYCEGRKILFREIKKDIDKIKNEI